MEIWLKQEGEEYGPYTLEQVKEYVDNGEVTLEDEAWFDGCEDYVTVGDIPNFTSPRKIAREEPRKQKVTRVEPRKKNPIVIASIVVSSVLLVTGLVVGGFYILKASSAKKKDPEAEAPKIVVDLEKLERRDELGYFEGKPFTGVAVAKYENGQKAGEYTFKDGKEHGLWIGWYETGEKESEGTWKDGKKDGMATGWWENGQKSYEATYKDGEEISTKSWDEDGNSE